MKKPIQASLFIAVLALFVGTSTSQAQYRSKSPAEILREAQERQEAIQQAGRDLQRNLSRIVEDRDAQEQRERQLRREEERAEREAARIQREREEEAQQNRLQRQREQEEQAELRQAQNVAQNRQQYQSTVARESSTSSTPSVTEKGWTGWQCVSGSASGGGIDVRYRREGGAWVSWSWQFRNRYSQPVTIRYTRVTGSGERMKSWTPAKPNDLSAADTNMGGDVKPDVEITTVEFRKIQ